MIIDLDNAFWTDEHTEMSDDDGLVASFMLGFSPVAEIFVTKYAIEHGFISKDNPNVNPMIKYVAIFNGYGNTFEEMEQIFNSNFNEFPATLPFPIISQSDLKSELKKSVKVFVELQWGATRLSKSDLLIKMEKEDEVLRNLIDRYMKVFSIKNELN